MQNLQTFLGNLNEDGLRIKATGLRANMEVLSRSLELAKSFISFILLNFDPNLDVKYWLRGSSKNGLAISVPAEHIDPDIDIDLIVSGGTLGGWCFPRGAVEQEYMDWVRRISNLIRMNLHLASNIQWNQGVKPVTRSFKLRSLGIDVEIFPKIYRKDTESISVFGKQRTFGRIDKDKIPKPLPSHIDEVQLLPKDFAIILLKYFIKHTKTDIKSYHLPLFAEANVPATEVTGNERGANDEEYQDTLIWHWIVKIWSRILSCQYRGSGLWVNGRDVFHVDQINLKASEHEALAVLHWDQATIEPKILPKTRFEV